MFGAGAFNAFSFNSAFDIGNPLFEQALVAYWTLMLPGVKLYPLRRPQSSPLPAATFSINSKVHGYNQRGADGTVIATIQFDIYSKTYGEAVDTAEQLRQILQGFMGSLAGVDTLFSELTDESHEYEQPADGSDNGVYHVTSNYSIEYRESIHVF